jgi:hypothetical protein
MQNVESWQRREVIVLSTFSTAMPRLTIDVEAYRNEIERRLLQNHQRHAEILTWLETEDATYYNAKKAEASLQPSYAGNLS